MRREAVVAGGGVVCVCVCVCVVKSSVRDELGTLRAALSMGLLACVSAPHGHTTLGFQNSRRGLLIITLATE